VKEFDSLLDGCYIMLLAMAIESVAHPVKKPIYM